GRGVQPGHGARDLRGLRDHRPDRRGGERRDRERRDRRDATEPKAHRPTLWPSLGFASLRETCRASFDRPPYTARPPSSASSASRRLYSATRSDRESDPVLICPQPVPTARSAIVVSSVSPERCDITAA